MATTPCRWMRIGTALCVLAPVASAEQPQPQAKTVAGWTLAEGQWQATAERLEQKKYSATEAAFAFRPETVFSDTFFAARFKVVDMGEKGVGATGFVFRSTDSNHYYYAHFDVRNRQVVLVAATAAKTWIEIQRARRLNLEMDTWHEGRIEVHGDQIRVFLDGEKVLEARDKRYPAGVVGFRIGQAQVVIEDITFEGTAATLDKPWRYTPRDARSTWPERFHEPHQKTICEETNAGVYQAFPDVCKLANGDLYCVFYSGYGHVSKPSDKLPRGGRICSIRSSDGGLTWSRAVDAIDLPEDDRDPSVMQLPDGTLLCNFFQGHPVARCLVARSTDNGQTWEPDPVEVPPPPGLDKLYCSARILRLSDGTLLLPVYGRTDGVKNYASGVVRSTDNGRTWGDGTVIVDDRTHAPGHCEPALARMPDGTLICHLRPCMCQTESTDDGRTWSIPHKLPFKGHAPDLLLTSRNILLSAHRIPGTSLHYSLDFGKTWSENVPIDRVGGAYPSMVELDDGTILCVYYEEGGGSSIRATRFKATPEGIEFIAWP